MRLELPQPEPDREWVVEVEVTRADPRGCLLPVVLVLVLLVLVFVLLAWLVR